MIFVYFRTVSADVKFQENCLDVFHYSSEDFSIFGSDSTTCLEEINLVFLSKTA